MTRPAALIAMGVLAAVLFGLLASSGPAVLSGAQGEEILAAAWSGRQAVPYMAEGETAVKFEGRWLRSKIRVHADGRRQLVEYTTGPVSGSVVCCDMAHRWQRTPDGNVVSYPVGPGVFAETSPQIDAIKRNYRFLYHGRSAAAKRPADVVTLVARGTNRRVRRLWVDAERSIILATAQYDAAGERTAWWRYSSVAFEPELKMPQIADAQEKEDATSATTPGDSGATAGFRSRDPSYLPSGYRTVGRATVVNCPCGCAAVSEVRRYSDGIRSFTLFQSELRGHHCALDSACEHGLECGDGCRATRYGPGTTVSRRKGALAVVAVGDPSVSELRRVIASL